MTIIEQCRLAGIRAHLLVRGRRLTHVRSGTEFTALADHAPGFKAAPAAEGEYAFGPEERSQDSFYALREGLPKVAVGDELTSEGGSHRVVAVEDTPNNLMVRFTVEVGHA
ncbi:MAG: hypothetical protein M5U12_38100 [Verrucomicrobia bacterium]|nr:hypothetical protein [Verrucomicrobiota bacterium]